MHKKIAIFFLITLMIFIFPLNSVYGAVNSAGAVVLVNSDSENRSDFDRYLKLYLDYLDIANLLLNT